MHIVFLYAIVYNKGTVKETDSPPGQKGKSIMKQFEIGKTYTMASPCDRNCVWTYTVTKRTAKTITINDGQETKTCRVNAQTSEYRDAESIFPLGRYSMCPVLSADKEERPEVQEPTEEAKAEAKIITLPRKKYKVYDLYEGKDILGYANTMEGVRNLARIQDRDTDGKCIPVYAELNPETGKYKFSQYKPVEDYMY